MVFLAVRLCCLYVARFVVSVCRSQFFYFASSASSYFSFIIKFVSLLRLASWLIHLFSSLVEVTYVQILAQTGYLEPLIN